MAKSRGFTYLVVSVFLLVLQRLFVHYHTSFALLLAVLVALLMLLHVSTSISNYSISNLDNSERFCYILLLIISLSLPVRSLVEIDSWSISRVARLVVHPKSFTPYFLPLLALYAMKKIDCRKIIIFSSILAIIYILSVTVNFSALMKLRSLGMAHYSSYLGVSGYGSAAYIVYSMVSAVAAPQIIFLMKRYVPGKHWWISAVNILAFLSVSVLLARRTSVFCTGLILIASYFFIFKKYKKSIFFLIPVVFGCVYVLYFSGSFDFFLMRLTSDTRSGVELAFFRDMDVVSILFGRGALGMYYDPGFEYGEFNGYRDEIETGYLNLILKGGVVYLILYVYVLLRAWYLGCFKSRNTLSKIYGAMALISCISLIPYGIPQFNYSFMLLWIGVGVCLNKKIRMLSDDQVRWYVWN